MERPRPEEEPEPTYYDLLGLKRNATPDEVKENYHFLANKLHPDVNHHPMAQEIFKVITEAYNTLSSDERKKEYDESLAAPIEIPPEPINYYDKHPSPPRFTLYQNPQIQNSLERHRREVEISRRERIRILGIATIERQRMLKERQKRLEIARKEIKRQAELAKQERQRIKAERKRLLAIEIMEKRRRTEERRRLLAIAKAQRKNKKRT